MKEKIIQLGQWGQKHWLQLIIIMSILMMIFLFLVLFSWLFGYWSNALRGTHFELMSCWSGVTAVGGGYRDSCRSWQSVLDKIWI